MSRDALAASAPEQAAAPCGSKGDASLSVRWPGSPAPATFAIEPLALRMLVTAPVAVLVTLPGKALRVPARRAAAAPGAIDVAVIAAGAKNHLAKAADAVEQTGVFFIATTDENGVEPRPKPQDTAHMGRASHGSGGAAPAVARKQTGPAPHRSRPRECTPAALAVRAEGSPSARPPTAE